MKLGDAIELTTICLKNGVSVSVKPITYEDMESLTARVILDLPFLQKGMLEDILGWAEHYDCDVLIANETVIFE